MIKLILVLSIGYIMLGLYDTFVAPDEKCVSPPIRQNRNHKSNIFCHLIGLVPCRRVVGTLIEGIGEK